MDFVTADTQVLGYTMITRFAFILLAFFLLQVEQGYAQGDNQQKISKKAKKKWKGVNKKSKPDKNQISVLRCRNGKWSILQKMWTNMVEWKLGGRASQRVLSLHAISKTKTSVRNVCLPFVDRVCYRETLNFLFNYTSVL